MRITNAACLAMQLVLGRRILLCYLVSACTTWRTIPPSALPPSVPVAEYDRVRVIGRDSSRIELRRARFDQDSVSGYGNKRDLPRRVSMPVGDVARVESSEPHATRTLLLIGTVLATLVGGAISW
jgi:hypothetical protein